MVPVMTVWGKLSRSAPNLLFGYWHNLPLARPLALRIADDFSEIIGVAFGGCNFRKFQEISFHPEFSGLAHRSVHMGQFTRSIHTLASLRGVAVATTPRVIVRTRSALRCRRAVLLELNSCGQGQFPIELSLSNQFHLWSTDIRIRMVLISGHIKIHSRYTPDTSRYNRIRI